MRSALVWGKKVFTVPGRALSLLGVIIIMLEYPSAGERRSRPELAATDEFCQGVIAGLVRLVVLDYFALFCLGKLRHSFEFQHLRRQKSSDEGGCKFKKAL